MNGSSDSSLAVGPAMGVSSPLRRALLSTDYMSLFMLSLYTLLDVVFFTRVRAPVATFSVNVLAIVAIVAFAEWDEQTGDKLAAALHAFYIVPVGYMLYAQSHNYIRIINPGQYDVVLASWDRAVFGLDPVLWVQRFAHPVFTEYLQIWYAGFQIMLVVLGLDLFASRKLREFRITISTLLLGFYVSYMLYVFMPAIGPRFTGHRFDTLNQDLPGLFLTGPLRVVINAGNNIAPGLKSPYVGVNPDCMPSGHTMMSMLAILLAWRYRARMRWFFTIGGVSVIISTVYLQYHYVVDVIAGIALAIIVFVAHRGVVRMWERAGIRV